MPYCAKTPPMNFDCRFNGLCSHQNRGSQTILAGLAFPDDAVAAAISSHLAGRMAEATPTGSDRVSPGGEPSSPRAARREAPSFHGRPVTPARAESKIPRSTDGFERSPSSSRPTRFSGGIASWLRRSTRSVPKLGRPKSEMKRVTCLAAGTFRIGRTLIDLPPPGASGWLRNCSAAAVSSGRISLLLEINSLFA